MKQFVCLSAEPWQAVPTRTQQLMTRLRDAQVLFFEPGGSGGPRREGDQVRAGLTVYTLPSVLEVDEKYSYLFRRGLTRVSRFIRDKLQRHRFQNYVLWTTDPRQVHLLEELEYAGAVYDCDREWSALPPRWESDLALACDVVFAASPLLADRLSPCNDNIALLPNGVNYPMFTRPTDTPAELRALRAPVFGYEGTLWRDLELSPVLAAARQRPDWVFVFVGAVEAVTPTLEALRALPNVAFLGWKSPVELPDYLSRFDVCLDLYRRRDLGSDILPQRLYEYLSTGKPIVSMLWDDQVESFPDVVYSAHTHPEFIRMCADALAEAGPWARTRRRDYGRAAAWSSRAAEVCRILSSIGLY